MPLASLPPQPLPPPIVAPPPAPAPEPTPVKKAQAEPANIWEHLTRGFELEEPLRPQIRRVAAHHAAHPGSTRHTLKRSEPYLWEIIEQVEARGMPLEIALLPAIETRFNPKAVSPRGAAGLWQFIGSTGELYGLEQSYWQDARLDTVASTRAALDYLTYLHGRYDDWLLALAAYNAGEARVMRAIKRNRKAGKPADYWHIKLPKETRQYVPRLLGLAHFIKNADDYGFPLPRVADANEFTVVKLKHQLDLTLAAELAGMPLNDVLLYNPALKHWTTGPQGRYQLILPKEPGNKLRTALNALDANDWMTWQRYRIRKGDTIGEIAQRYGTTTEIIKRANDLKGNYLRAGNSLLLPVPRHTGQLIAANIPVPIALSKTENPLPAQTAQLATSHAEPGLYKARAGTHKIRYQIQTGDTLSAIAKAYNVSVDALAGWNNMKTTATLRSGRMLTIWIGTRANKKDQQTPI
ncbi:MAG: transglycosylase SLT domain-containing protein [Salinisphaeraceae bacterium]|nr:transglycosylase SLT domain-containing protein [Salinisphaeraceae bacterium]